MPYGARVDYSRLFGIRVPGEGPQDAQVALIGERPGKDEARQGRPFVGAAGLILNTFLIKAGIRRDQCYVTNIVKDYQDSDPEPEEIERDREELEVEILHLNNLRFIGTLGAFATRWFLGGGAAMDLVHGIPHAWTALWANECVLVPVYHPASGLYETTDLALTYWDLCQLKKAIDEELEQPTDLHREPRYVKAWGGRFNAPRWYMDTEGSSRKPWGGSLTSRPGEARVFPANHSPRLRPGTHVVFHNAPHDLLVLKSMGVEVEDDCFDDSMLKAYNLGGIHPQGLKPLAYRLAGMTMQSYEEVTGPASKQKALDWLEGLLAGDDRVPERGHSLFKRVVKVLTDSEENGAEPRERWAKILEDHPEWADLGTPPEATLDDIPEDIAVAYAGRDADATCRIDPVLDRLMEEAGTTECYRLDLSVVPAVTRMREVGVRIAPDKLQVLHDEYAAQMETIERELGFNPNSGDQVAVYLFEALGLPKGRRTKKGKREATDDRILEGLRHLHPDVGRICDYREADKLRVKCKELLGTADDRDRVHSDLAMRAKTGRFTAKEPNLLAVPAHTESGAKIRSCIIPEQGHILGDWDLSGIEMRVMADESRDEAMCELFREGGDVHANTALRIFGIEAEKQDEHKHRLPAKKVGFGTIMGITGKGLVEQMNLAGANRDGRWTEQVCDDMLDAFIHKAYPGVGRYMEQRRAETRRYGYTRDRWGRVNYLPGIWAPIARIREEAERQSHALRIQGGAAGIIKSIIRDLWPHFKRWRAEGWYAEMLLPVHDEILFEVTEDAGFMQEVEAVVNGVMENAVSLCIPVKAKGGWGRTWREAKEAGK